MFWFDKNAPGVLFGDCRVESHELCDGRSLHVTPDQVMDFRDLPFDNNTFNLIVFDPPHLKSAGRESYMALKYGCLDPANWKTDIASGFAECWRVLRSGGTLILKWNETQIKLGQLLPLLSAAPLYGQTTTQNLKTHWLVFHKFERST